MPRGGRKTPVYWERNRCLNAFGLGSGVRKSFYNNVLNVYATCVSNRSQFDWPEARRIAVEISGGAGFGNGQQVLDERIGRLCES